MVRPKLRTRDILCRYCKEEQAVVVFISMEDNVVGKLIPCLARGDGAEVVYNAKHSLVFLLNEKLRADGDYQVDVWRRADQAFPVSEIARQLGLTLDQVVLVHMMQRLELGHCDPTAKTVMADSIGEWASWKGNKSWLYVEMDLQSMWDHRKTKAPDCSINGNEVCN